VTAPQLTANDVQKLATGFRLSRAIHAAADLGLAAALHDGPLDVGTLARRVDADPFALLLLLRALASEGIFDEAEDGTFAVNDAALALLPVAQGGGAELILGWSGHPAVYRALERLSDGVRQGRPAFEVVHESGFFDWLGTHPPELASYLTAVGGEEPEEFVDFMDVVDLSNCTLLGDIGGGGGGLLRAAIQRWPHLRGMLIELPAVAPKAHDLIAAAGLQDQITVATADIRHSIPSGPDCYLMSTVLRYFDDTAAADVLLRVREALATATGPRYLVLIEMPIPEGAAQAPSAMKSLIEYALSGGQDRTLAALTVLLEQAGFTNVTSHVWDEPYWVIRATAP
jgi:O-methyltransferase domain